MVKGRIDKSKGKQQKPSHLVNRASKFDTRAGKPPQNQQQGLARDAGGGSLHAASDLFEAEVLDGLKPLCVKELTALLGADGKILRSTRPDQLTVQVKGDPSRLLKLRTVVAVFQLLYFKVPHPRSITQGEDLERLVTAINRIRKGARFDSFRIGAAGSDSPTFKKIKSIISRETGLSLDEDTGEMVIRFRRSQLKPFGWDVLIRTTPRPLSARQWRVANMPGALNATLAAAMVLITEPRPNDRFLNLMCGSGTILAERLAICKAQRTVGVDVTRSAIDKAERNLSRVLKGLTLVHEDIHTLSLKDRSVNSICADLPWGRLVGEKDKLQELYAVTLRQAGRVCEAGGKFAVLTQENTLFESVLSTFTSDWELLSSFRVKQADYKPKLYLLRRRE